MLNFKRNLRTPSSEVFFIYKDNMPLCELHLHYLNNNTFQSTILLLKEFTEIETQDIVNEIMDHLVNDGTFEDPQEVCVYQVNHFNTFTYSPFIID